MHISEITNGFVRDIQDYVNVGDEVSVKVLSIDEESGKISLSLKAVTRTGRIQKKNRIKNHLEVII